MYRTATLLILFLLALPSAVFAHATPVETSPNSGANVENATEVRIRFSERLEGGSSRITVKDVTGKNVQEGTAVVGEDTYTLSVPMTASEGVYTVSWSVVSKDDGHFTKGSYAFSIGSSFPPVSSADATVVQITTLPEATGMFVEFFGNSLLWGIILVFAFVVRPLIAKGQYHMQGVIKRIYPIFAYCGVVAIIAGAISQIVLKTVELSGLHEIGFNEGLLMYFGTVAGSSTLYRMGAALALAIFFTFFRRKIFASPRFSIYEGLLLACLLVFAYFRALVSHATANPFFPEVSIVVNVLHLIEKDLWLGVLLVLIALLLTRGRGAVDALLPRVSVLLATNFIAISFSASYIIWLHLRHFGNISTTMWGETFIALLTASVLLVGLRTYHVFAYRLRPRLFSHSFPFTISAEAAASALVVFFSSLIIITSPPLHHVETKIFQGHEQGISVRLEASPFEDGIALLSVSPESETPIVLIGESDGGLQVKLEKRFAGGYVFPLDLLKGKDTDVHVIARKTGGYDARFAFASQQNDFLTREGHGRSFDSFTITMIVLALLSAFFALALLWEVRHTSPVSFSIRHASIIGVILGLSLGLVFGLQIVVAAQKVFGNDFRKQCIEDGNMWHLMQPARGGVYISKTPHEGCMMMSGLYHITDIREYKYLRSLPPASVQLSTSPETPKVGIPTTLSLTFLEEDGSPAKMSVIHEKLVHLIVISADMSEFAHLHPEDILTSGDDVAKSRFEISHSFPKAGEYLVAVDYLHGLTPESRQFRIQVDGNPEQEELPRQFSSSQQVHGLDIALDYPQPFAREMATLRYTVRKDGTPVMDMEPYLSAAMHLAMVKNDLSEFIHTHGEVHPQGYVPPKTTTLSHNHAPPPPRFGPNIEAHTMFPSPGIYTLFGEFKWHGIVVPTTFTVKVE